MNCRILDECAGRLRVHAEVKKLTMHEADILEFYLNGTEGILHASVHERTGNIIILYGSADGQEYRKYREGVIAALSTYCGPTRELEERMPEDSGGREINAAYQDRLAAMALFKAVRDLLLPLPVRAVYSLFRAVHFLIRGIKSLRSRKLKVEVLDAVSVTVSVIRGDFDMAGNIMFLLDAGDLLEQWTRKKSLNDLAQRMSLNADRVWMKNNGTEVLVPISRIRNGDLICVRMGGIIPLDGIVAEGEAMVNQASMTGEALPVRKMKGAPVYAGTVAEEGNCIIRVTKECGNGRYDRIISMIEESEKMKSDTESRAMSLADRLVPYTLGGAAMTWGLTRNIEKAISVLMVDFSCALKLSMPLSVLSAMRECGEHHITVKGGKFLEKVSAADTIVFDKTGTLTHAAPKVVQIVSFGKRGADEVLKIAACLEEHFPHSIANAVVKEAKERNICHEEMHSEVEYVVAHGISSRINGKKSVIGSAHFVFEDEKCVIPGGQERRFREIPQKYSQLFLAIDGTLAGVICISDPLRREAADVLQDLKSLGTRNAVMMTGDSERVAASIAREVGVDTYFSEVLPEDKADFIRRQKKMGHTVIMVGDGINDSPALSEADVGIAIRDGAAIARQIADITISADDLHELVFMKKIADALQGRIKSNYRFVLGFNSALIILGIAGIFSPSASALLHNLSTIGIGMRNTADLL